MTDKRLLIVWNILLNVILLFVVSHYKGYVQPKDIVFEYCNNSRITDMTSEQTCGDLQDFYNVEFLCDDRNDLPTNHCWVEQK